MKNHHTGTNKSARTLFERTHPTNTPKNIAQDEDTAGP